MLYSVCMSAVVNSPDLGPVKYLRQSEIKVILLFHVTGAMLWIFMYIFKLQTFKNNLGDMFTLNLLNNSKS